MAVEGQGRGQKTKLRGLDRRGGKTWRKGISRAARRLINEAAELGFDNLNASELIGAIRASTKLLEAGAGRGLEVAQSSRSRMRLARAAVQRAIEEAQARAERDRPKRTPYGNSGRNVSRLSPRIPNCSPVWSARRTSWRGSRGRGDRGDS